MPKFLQKSFSKGILSPNAITRENLPGYNEALRDAHNFLIGRTGELYRRGGTALIEKRNGPIERIFPFNAQDRTWLIIFERGVADLPIQDLSPSATTFEQRTQDYPFVRILELTDLKLQARALNDISLSSFQNSVPCKIYKKGNTALEAFDSYSRDPKVPFAEGELANMTSCQIGNVMVFSNSSGPPFWIRREGDTFVYYRSVLDMLLNGNQSNAVIDALSAFPYSYYGLGLVPQYIDFDDRGNQSNYFRGYLTLGVNYDKEGLADKNFDFWQNRLFICSTAKQETDNVIVYGGIINRLWRSGRGEKRFKVDGHLFYRGSEDLEEIDNTRSLINLYLCDWSAFVGWPRSITEFENRFVYGGSDAYPAKIWFSSQPSMQRVPFGNQVTITDRQESQTEETGPVQGGASEIRTETPIYKTIYYDQLDLFNKDDKALGLVLRNTASADSYFVNDAEGLEIYWIIKGEVLFIGTNKGVFISRGTDASAPNPVPFNTGFQQVDYVPVKRVFPVIEGKTLYFVTRDHSVRRLMFGSQSGYKAENVDNFSREIVRDTSELKNLVREVRVPSFDDEQSKFPAYDLEDSLGHKAGRITHNLSLDKRQSIVNINEDTDEVSVDIEKIFPIQPEARSFNDSELTHLLSPIFGNFESGSYVRDSDADFELPMSGFSGSVSDGITIWFSDSDSTTAKALAYKVSDLKPIPTRNIDLLAGLRHWHGGVSDRKFLWFIDNNNNMARCYLAQNRSRVPGKDINLGAGDWQGALFDGEVLIFVQTNGTIKEFNPHTSSISTRPTSVNGTPINLGAGSWKGATSDANTLWFLDDTSNTLRAYRQRDRMPIGESDISLGEGNWEFVLYVNNKLYVGNHISSIQSGNDVYEKIDAESDDFRGYSVSNRDDFVITATHFWVPNGIRAFYEDNRSADPYSLYLGQFDKSYNFVKNELILRPNPARASLDSLGMAQGGGKYWWYPRLFYTRQGRGYDSKNLTHNADYIVKFNPSTGKNFNIAKKVGSLIVDGVIVNNTFWVLLLDNKVKAYNSDTGVEDEDKEITLNFSRNAGALNILSDGAKIFIYNHWDKLLYPYDLNGNALFSATDVSKILNTTELLNVDTSDLIFFGPQRFVSTDNGFFIIYYLDKRVDGQYKRDVVSRFVDQNGNVLSSLNIDFIEDSRSDIAGKAIRSCRFYDSKLYVRFGREAQARSSRIERKQDFNEVVVYGKKGLTRTIVGKTNVHVYEKEASVVGQNEFSSARNILVRNVPNASPIHPSEDIDYLIRVFKNADLLSNSRLKDFSPYFVFIGFKVYFRYSFTKPVAGENTDQQNWSMSTDVKKIDLIYAKTNQDIDNTNQPLLANGDKNPNYRDNDVKSITNLPSIIDLYNSNNSFRTDIPDVNKESQKISDDTGVTSFYYSSVIEGEMKKDSATIIRGADPFEDIVKFMEYEVDSDDLQNRSRLFFDKPLSQFPTDVHMVELILDEPRGSTNVAFKGKTLAKLRRGDADITPKPVTADLAPVVLTIQQANPPATVWPDATYERSAKPDKAPYEWSFIKNPDFGGGYIMKMSDHKGNELYRFEFATVVTWRRGRAALRAGFKNDPNIGITGKATLFKLELFGDNGFYLGDTSPITLSPLSNESDFLRRINIYIAKLERLLGMYQYYFDLNLEQDDFKVQIVLSPFIVKNENYKPFAPDTRMYYDWLKKALFIVRKEGYLCYTRDEQAGIAGWQRGDMGFEDVAYLGNLSYNPPEKHPAVFGTLGSRLLLNTEGLHTLHQNYIRNLPNCLDEHIIFTLPDKNFNMTLLQEKLKLLGYKDTDVISVSSQRGVIGPNGAPLVEKPVSFLEGSFENYPKAGNERVFIVGKSFLSSLISWPPSIAIRDGGTLKGKEYKIQGIELWEILHADIQINKKRAQVQKKRISQAYRDTIGIYEYLIASKLDYDPLFEILINSPLPYAITGWNLNIYIPK